jgi:acylglycerol lipase
VAAMDADPLIAGEVQPVATVAALARANDRLKTGFASIRCPVLILHGTEDKVTRPSGSLEFHEVAGSTDKTLKLYDGHSHDLFNDLGRERVVTDVVAWINARLPAAKGLSAVG